MTRDEFLIEPMRHALALIESCGFFEARRCCRFNARWGDPGKYWSSIYSVFTEAGRGHA